MLLHVFATCRCGSGRFRRRTSLRQGRWHSSVLPTPVGPRKMNEPMGRLGSCRPARARRSASADCADGLILAHDALVQQLLHMEQALAFVLRHLLDRHARPAGHNLGDILLGDHVVAVVFALLPGRSLLGDVLTQRLRSSSRRLAAFSKS